MAAQAYLKLGEVSAESGNANGLQHTQNWGYFWITLSIVYRDGEMPNSSH